MVYCHQDWPVYVLIPFKEHWLVGMLAGGYSADEKPKTWCEIKIFTRGV